jgi:hypothetical protein
VLRYPGGVQTLRSPRTHRPASTEASLAHPRIDSQPHPIGQPEADDGGGGARHRGMGGRCWERGARQKARGEPTGEQPVTSTSRGERGRTPMAKALKAIRTGGMAALILAWAVGGEVKLLAVVLLALFVVHHVIALAAGFVAYAAIELAFCTWIDRHWDGWKRRPVRECARRSTSGAVDASCVTSPAGSQVALGSCTALPRSLPCSLPTPWSS